MLSGLSKILLCSNVNFRGLPYWLKEVPDIIFRSDNAPFKVSLLHHLRCNTILGDLMQ